MKIIIFSKNRAMQLEALLRSLQKNKYNIQIIYLAENNFYQNGYDKLFKEINRVDVTYIKETTLKFNVLHQLINNHNNLIAFMVDDDIVYDNIFPVGGIAEPIMCDNNIIKDSDLPQVILKQNECYSLRLHSGIKNPIHFQYTMSLDGNVFRQKDIRPLIDSIEFNNPNQLESALQGRFGHNFKMKYGKGHLIGFNHNRVSSTSHCAFTNEFSEEYLNKLYLTGLLIDFEAMNIIPSNDVHTTKKYLFKKANIQ